VFLGQIGSKMAIDKRFYPQSDPNQAIEKFSIGHFDSNQGFGGHPAQCLRLWRAPGRFAASPTQPFNAVRMLKSKPHCIDFDVDFNILTALKGWVGHAPQGRGALHIIII
jgi:hypothetical protein